MWPLAPLHTCINARFSTVETWLRLDTKFNSGRGRDLVFVVQAFTVAALLTFLCFYGTCALLRRFARLVSPRCQISAGQVWAAEITAAVVLVLRLLPFSWTDFAVVFVQFLSWSLKNLILYGSKMAASWSWSQSSRDHRFELMMLLLGEFLPFLGVVRLGFFPTNTHHCSQVGACKRYSCNRARPFPWSRTQHWLRLAELSWRPPRLLPGLDLDIPWTQHDHGTNYSRRRDRPWAGISASQLLALHAQPSPRHGTPRNKATKLLKRKTTRNTSLRAALPARNVKLPALAISLLPCAFAWRFPFSALHYWNWYKNKNLLLPLFNFSPSTRSSLSFTSSTGT